MYIDKDEIVSLTEEYGGQWGLNHTKRLLKIISDIDEGLQYNHEAVWLAVYLHDWGAYPRWAESGVVGVLRDFSKKPNDLRKAFETTKNRAGKLPGMLCLEKSREIAENRVKLMNDLLKEFEEETFGYF